MTEQLIFAVSGIKNSGKTTLIESLLPILNRKGLKTAVIKHDGHDFVPDVPGTDSYRFAEKGAAGIAVFSEYRYMIVKQQSSAEAEMLIRQFPEADLILLEGFKHSDYPKLEIIRKGNSSGSVCKGCNLYAIATDLDPSDSLYQEVEGALPGIPILDLNDAERIAQFLCDMIITVGEKKE